MKWLARLLLVSVSVALLSSCGGTATGNPGSNLDAPDRTAGEGCHPDPLVCPNGTLVYRQGVSCEFDPCP